MTKNLHFCTKDLIRRIRYDKNDKYVYIKSYRTGFVPDFKPGEVIRLNERNNGKNTFLKSAKVISVIPIQYRDIGLRGKREILDSYKDKIFPLWFWFFEITLRKWSYTHNKVYEDTGFMDQYIENENEGINKE